MSVFGVVGYSGTRGCFLHAVIAQTSPFRVIGLMAPVDSNCWKRSPIDTRTTPDWWRSFQMNRVFLNFHAPDCQPGGVVLESASALIHLERGNAHDVLEEHQDIIGPHT